MTKGLKQLAEQAIRYGTRNDEPLPVEVSAEALRALSFTMREWSGWPDSKVINGVPEVSPYAECDHATRTFTADIRRLILNPNRVLLTVTPFRLRQEAVLTGCLLHEAGHARHSHWLPRTEAEALAKPLLHGEVVSPTESVLTGGQVLTEWSGKPPTKQTVALARLLEEPRVEGLMARDADQIGARDLAWTMRASMAALAPLTHLAVDPDQRIMDLITSWVLRAGKQIAVAHWSSYLLPHWVGAFNDLLHQTLVQHFDQAGAPHSITDASRVISLLFDMATSTDDRGTFAIDTARRVLDILFPETSGDDTGNEPMPGEGCTGQPDGDPEEGDGDEGQSKQSQSEDSDTDEDEDGDGSGEDESDDESDEDGDGGDGEDSDPGESADGDSGSGGEEAEDPLAAALKALEQDAKDEAETEQEQEAEKAPAPLNAAGGAGGEGTDGDEWRQPGKMERDVQKGAERFLRTMIAPAEASKVMLSDSPSATVDAAEMAAWKADGGQRTPHFFKRTKRFIEPSPPVKIAILADVSGSMDELQGPTALLSWALSAAALDLRNFAGRGQQVESCLIHWGSNARVIQGVGEPLPGLKEWECYEGTSALDDAYELVEEQMPGFFDLTETPTNRLVVHFTDWELMYSCKSGATRYTHRLLAAGVNMLTVAPRDYSEHRSYLGEIMRTVREMRGQSSVMRYDPKFPERVWDVASNMLNGTAVQAQH